MAARDTELGSIHPTREELAAMTPDEREAAEAANAHKRVRTRTFPESNYHAVFHNGKTLRFAIRDDEDITELEFPEFYDIKLTDRCPGDPETGRFCPYCYQDSRPAGDHYENLVEKLESFFLPMSFNERPFQAALGGGETTSSPEFADVCRWLAAHGIMPNYTTNGTNLTPEVLDVTGECCGGVALSCHPHLERYWKEGVGKLLPIKERNPHFKVNFHNIISDAASIDDFRRIYEEFHGTIDYFVLLPLIRQGRAEGSDKEIDYPYLEETLAALREEYGSPELSDLAFGARFFEWLKTDAARTLVPVSIYEPEIMSKFLDMRNMRLYGSSFEHGAGQE